ncbi:MAG: ABC transporter ATP-binding protein, partial [Clostridia bacterium]|nr:ABC transporter ATP-binding protein [Clostridia bacterium]
MQPNEKQKHLKFFGIGKIFPYIKPYGKVLIVMAFWGLVTSLIDVGMTLFQRYAVNHFVELKTLDTLPWFIIAYIAAICMSSISTYISCTRAMAVEVRVNRDLRSAAFTHLQTLSFSYFNQNSVGYIHARVLSDTSRIGSLASWSFMDAVWHSSYLIFASVVMLAINAKLALMVLAIMPLVVILFSFFQNKLIKANREIREINSTITSNFNEGITGAKTVKTLAIEDGMQARFEGDTKKMKARSVLAARLRGLFACTMTFASSLALAVVLWKHDLIAADEVGTFSMFMSYA